MEIKETKRIAVARAICAACGETPEHAGDAGGNQFRWQDYLGIADAAIAAMSDDDALANVTKDGVKVRIGQVWKDLDSRSGDRHCKVFALAEGRAHMNRCSPDGRVASQAVTKVAIARMHHGSSGWSLVSDA